MQLDREDDARVLVRILFRTQADLAPDGACGILITAVHGVASPRCHHAFYYPVDQPNAIEFNNLSSKFQLEYFVRVSPPASLPARNRIGNSPCRFGVMGLRPSAFRLQPSASQRVGDDDGAADVPSAFIGAGEELAGQLHFHDKRFGRTGL